jgi:hypothetical protein
MTEGVISLQRSINHLLKAAFVDTYLQCALCMAAMHNMCEYALYIVPFFNE